MSESLTRVYANKAALGPESIRLRGEKVEGIDGISIVPVLVSRESAFGAEVSGINWKNPVSDEVVKQVRRPTEIIQATKLMSMTTAHQSARQVRGPHLPRNRTRQ
jgi:hypothetical protein